MAIDLLKQLASSSLPATFCTAEEIDKVKLLRAAGLVIALTSPPNASSPSGIPDTAQVLAITQKGREELGKFSLPENPSHDQSARTPWWMAKLHASISTRRARGWR